MRLSCGACGEAVPKNQVFEVFDAMRFLDRTLRNEEISQVNFSLIGFA